MSRFCLRQQFHMMDPLNITTENKTAVILVWLGRHASGIEPAALDLAPD